MIRCYKYLAVPASQHDLELLLGVLRLGGDSAPVRAEPADGAVGIDIGWRSRDGGTRIAYWVGSDGREGELVIPTGVEQRHRKSSDLRSIRDLRRDALAASLGQWCPPSDSWLVGALAHVTQWRRIGHFHALARRWASDRVVGDAAVYEALAEFLMKDRHLHAWESHNRRRMERQIEGRILEWARDLCARYKTIVVEEIDLRALRAADTTGVAARQGSRLGPGKVIEMLARYAVDLQRVAAQWTTLRCRWCGVIREVKDQSRLVLECHACGRAEDQDATAARNLLASGDVRDQDGGPLDPVKTRGSARKMGARRNRRRKITGPLADGSIDGRDNK